MYIRFVSIYILIATAFSPGTGLGMQIDKQEWDRYTRLNNQENRLSDYRDPPPLLKIKLQMLRVINTSRKKYGAPPVQLDILASRVANKQSVEAAENNFTGHWNLRGEKPYHRYAFAGGRHHVSENAAASWIKGGAYSRDPSTILNLMTESHAQFMAEKAPYDGHKQTIIEPAHNYVGLGVHLTSRQFRYYELFVNKYLTFKQIPQHVSPGDSASIIVKPYQTSHYLVSVIGYYESFPSPMNRKKINQMGSYRDYSSQVVLSFTPWELETMHQQKSYHIPLYFPQEGLYYLKMYLDTTNPREYLNFSTAGKINASGLVIQVR